MPKKFHGENTKSAVARARKEALKQAELDKKIREEEDAYWKDDDKHLLRKQQRKDDKDKRKAENAERKALSKQLLEEEMKTIKPTSKAQPSNKLTRAEILLNQEKLNSEKTTQLKLPENEIPLEENVNRLQVDGLEARDVDQAIAILSIRDEVGDIDQHPERRMKAAYLQFEESELPRLKAENPNLRLSQLKQMLKKDWMKSPLNPLNQAQAAYHSK